MAKGRRVGEGPLSNQRKEVRRGGGGEGGGEGGGGGPGGAWGGGVGVRAWGREESGRDC